MPTSRLGCHLSPIVTVTIGNMPSTAPSKRGTGEAPALRGGAWKAGRRAELLEAADRAVRRLGPAASMDHMAAEAGISKVVLYRYFGDKGGLHQALARRYVGLLMSELRSALAGSTDPRARLTATIDAYVAFIEKNREAYDFLMHRAVREGPEAQETVADFMRGVAREVAEVLAGEISRLGYDPAPADAWAHGLVGMVQLAADWWLEQPDVPRKTLVNYLVALLWRGLGGAVQ
jgi:AcrR family transcriptional regulator